MKLLLKVWRVIEILLNFSLGKQLFRVFKEYLSSSIPDNECTICLHVLLLDTFKDNLDAYSELQMIKLKMKMINLFLLQICTIKFYMENICWIK
jgi:hypothetical protein